MNQMNKQNDSEASAFAVSMLLPNVATFASFTFANVRNTLQRDCSNVLLAH